MSSSEEVPWREPLEALLDGGRAELVRLVSALDGVGERVHSLSGTVTAAMLNAEMLVDAVREASEAEPGELGGAVRESLRRLRESIDGLKLAVREARLGRLGPVNPAAALRAAVEQARSRFTGIEWAASIEGALPLECHLHRGTDGFCDLASHLLTNAAEGRAGRHARRVEATLAFTPQRGQLVLEVRDDGPGFPAPLLDSAPPPLFTTKPGRLGLGLFECYRQARLSGGSLVLRNDPAGGAVARLAWAVTDVRLPPPVR